MTRNPLVILVAQTLNTVMQACQEKPVLSQGRHVRRIAKWVARQKVAQQHARKMIPHQEHIDAGSLEACDQRICLHDDTRMSVAFAGRLGSVRMVVGRAVCRREKITELTHEFRISHWMDQAQISGETHA